MKCIRCGNTIYTEEFCPRCGILTSTQATSIPGVQPGMIPLQPLSKFEETYEEKVARRKNFRKAYRITLIAAIFFMVMDLYQNSAPDADHLVQNPWPFVFQIARLIAMFALILTLILRSNPPMLFFIWAVTVSLAVRFFAVIYQYGIEGVTLTEWVWGALGLVVVGSFWIMKYGVQHRVKNW